MSEVTHKRSFAIRDWAACGFDTADFVDDPTCLWCAVGKWVADESEIVRVLTRNSVKDLQEVEDKKAWEHLEPLMKK